MAPFQISIHRGGFFYTRNGGWYERTIRNWSMATTDIEIGCSLLITPAAELIYGGTDGNADGWVTLGFNGLDYTLNVDGDEVPGTYTSVITYSIVNP